MPLINHSELNKIFQGTRTRIHAPKISVKKKSQDTLKNFSVKPFPAPSTPKDPRHIAGTALPNSTVRNSAVHLEQNKKSKDEDFKMKNEADNKKKIIQSTDESSASTLEFNLETIRLNKSNSRILELKARQKLLSSSQDVKDDVAAFEPRRPTMQSIKEAIEKAKQLEINRHKNVGTRDDFQNMSMSDASTSTDSRKGKKKKTFSKLKRTDSSTTSSMQITKTKNKPKKKKKVNDDNKKGKAAANKKA